MTPGFGGGIVTPSAVPRSTPTPLPAIPSGALSGTVIRATVLLVRASPFSGAPVVDRVLRGQTYQVLARDQDARWFLIQLSARQGWVWGYYLHVNGNEFNAPVANPFVAEGGASASTGIVAQSQAVLRLRAAPDTNAEQIGRVPWGEIMPVLSKTHTGWYQVIYQNTVGWVAAQYVKLVQGEDGSIPYSS